MSQESIDRLNYANDPRTRGPINPPTVYRQDQESGEWFDQELPWVYVVCPRCAGKGVHVNPSIDAGGLSGPLADDPEFVHDYMEGVYDVTCSGCEGRRVVPVIDRDNCSAGDLVEYDREQEIAQEDELVRMAEMRAGA